MSNESTSSSSDESSVSSQASIRAKSPALKQFNEVSPSSSNKQQTSPSIKSESESKQDDSNEISENLRSSLDINSISLTTEEEKETRVRPPSRIVHNHILPSGWTCNYDPDNDEYKFELLADNRQESEENNGFKLKSNFKKLNLTDRETMTTGLDINDLKDNISETLKSAKRPSLDFKQCKYGYHFPSSPTPSMLSELAKQVQKAPSTAPPAKVKQFGYGKTKLTMLSDEEEQSVRLKEMFPTATGPIIDHMIKIYQGREGCIKAALISLGYKRATDYGGQQATAQSPIMLMMSKPSSKKLFDKLVGYFPDKDETLIKTLMYQHKEVEHEIISTLVESGSQTEINTDKDLSAKSRGISKHDKNGAIMKLRYLKFLFPTCEEIELYHLLHSNDLDAQKVIEKVEKRGHKRVNIDEVMQNRKTQTQQMKAQLAATAAKEKITPVNPLELHRNRTRPTVTESRINNTKENIKKGLENSNVVLSGDGLILAALEASDYNEALAKKFLLEMKPIDESKFKKPYVIKREEAPSVVLYPCKGIQKSGDTSFMSVTANEYVSISKEVLNCETALALLKVDACTYTGDDIIETKFTHAIGRDKNLALGSVYKTLEIKDSLRVGSKKNSLCLGSNYRQVFNDKKNTIAKGKNKSLSLGRKLELNHGHNRKLIQRIHPFFA